MPPGVSYTSLAEVGEAGRLLQQIRGTKKSLECQAGGAGTSFPKAKGVKVSEKVGSCSKKDFQTISPLGRYRIDG